MFTLRWTEQAADAYADLRGGAEASLRKRRQSKRAKASAAEGLFQQVHKCITLLQSNPRHPGLQTHQYHSLEHPYEKGGKVFEAYAQNRTPGAYRVFWCYGPDKGQITIITITPHP